MAPGRLNIELENELQTNHFNMSFLRETDYLNQIQRDDLDVITDENPDVLNTNQQQHTTPGIWFRFRITRINYTAQRMMDWLA